MSDIEQFALKRVSFKMGTPEGEAVKSALDSEEGWRPPPGWRVVTVEWDVFGVVSWLTIWLERRVDLAHPYR